MDSPSSVIHKTNIRSWSGPLATTTFFFIHTKKCAFGHMKDHGLSLSNRLFAFSL